MAMDDADREGSVSLMDICGWPNAPQQRLLDEIGMREVAVTAREKRDAEHVVRMHSRGKSVSEISETLDVSEEVVKEIIAEHERKILN